MKLRELLPPDMPKLYDKGMTMQVYIDSNHDGDYVTHHSRLGLVVFFKNAPIYWSSKKETYCETSTYSSDLVAMNQAFGYVRGLQ